MKKLFKLAALLITTIISTSLMAQWGNVGLAGFSAGGADYTNIAIDGSGKPYVVYQDRVNSFKATVMNFDGSNWVVVGSVGFSAGSVYYTSIAIDGSGTPYVVYRDVNNSDKATVMKFDGSNWVIVGSAGFSAGIANYTSIAIDGSGTPYVVYQDRVNSFKATVMKFDGSNWVVVGSAGFSAGSVYYTSIAIDGSGTPYVVYQDASNSNKATVMKFDGSNWVVVGSVGFSAAIATYTSIAIDGSSTLYVAYRDGGNSSKATVMKFDGSNWVVVGSVGFSVGRADWTEIAIDGSGTPYVVYQDDSNSNKATVMKFGFCNTTSSTINPTECDSLVSPSGNYTWTTTGTYNDTIPNACGSDSVITVNLTINNSVITNATAVVECDSANINGNWYYTSQTVTDVFTSGAANGCDSTVITPLTIHTLCCDNTFTTCQTPIAPPGTIGGLESDISSSKKVYDNFSGIVGGITDIEWWGATGTAGSTCNENPKSFEVSFYNDNAGNVGTLIASYNISATGTASGSYFGALPVLKYSFSLPTPVSGVSEGWVSIQGNPAGSCEFYWITSPYGDGKAFTEGSKGMISNDLAYGLFANPSIPISDWAIYIGIFLIAGAIVVRYKLA